ncbi:MAG: hypothetical protein GX275_03595 [Clostridiales bacterium]|nr:hypothetical protein [Clostridiales bacterium]
MDETGHEKESSMSSKVVVQYAEVSVPIKIKPIATVGGIKSECVGEPMISYCKCHYNEDGKAIEIVVTQTLRIKVPVEYSTVATEGEASIEM